MPSPGRLAAAALLPLLLAAGCGRDAESAPPPPPATPQRDALSPLEQVPFEALYGVPAAENLQLQPVEIHVRDLPRGLDGVRIAAVAGLQLGLWQDNEAVAAAAIRRALEAEPDLVVLLGDYVGASEDTTALARVLAPLQGRRVMAVLGDQDVRTDSLEARVVRTLRAAGVQVLRNEAAALERNGAALQVVGLDPDLVARSWADQEYILATAGGDAGPRLLLTHFPALATRAPERRFAAILAANTFCGQVEVPGASRLSWVNSDLLPGARIEGVERLYRVRDNFMFVTCGVGYSFVPLRLGAPPEVAIVTLLGVGARRATAPQDAGVADTTLRRFQRDTVAPPDTAGPG